MSETRNPYEAPRAAVVDAPEPPATGRPGWVWVICILYAWGFFWGLGALALAVAGRLPAKTISTAPLDVALLLFGFALSGAFTVQLFRLRRNAFTLGVASLVFGVANFAHRLTDPDYVKLLLAPLWIGIALGWAINIAIVLYARSLRERGTLR